jgi:hypothetical protein
MSPPKTLAGRDARRVRVHRYELRLHGDFIFGREVEDAIFGSKWHPGGVWKAFAKCPAIPAVPKMSNPGCVATTA